MSEFEYLKRMFKSYYKDNKSKISLVSSLENREFGYIPWEKKFFMKRHISFNLLDKMKHFLIDEGPRHVYSSGAIYLDPEIQDMNGKHYQGCDLIIDIDADHFYTPCKETHDYWYCEECGEHGKGMVKKCKKCGKTKVRSLTWICETCLNITKNEIIKLIYDFLIPDFGIDLDQIKIAFSGHRGYHLKIEEEQIKTLSSEDRREIADYISGENISFKTLGLQERSGIFYTFSSDTAGWPQKIFRKILEILTKPDLEIQNILSNDKKFNFSPNLIKSFLNYKPDFINRIQNKREYILPSIEGFAIGNWKKFFKGIVHEVGVEIDTPVTVDIHRLIRYPGSLHGKTGFRVQEIYLDDLDDFNPLDENREKLDPIVFKSKVDTTQKVEIIEEQVPLTKIKGESFGPYTKGQKVEVPHHIAIFLLCKEVAKII